jgi:hypothetical protein
MIRLEGNSLFRILITFFTAFAVMVSYCFAATEPLRTSEGTGGITGWADNFIPSPAEEPALLTKTEESRLTPWRTGFQRGFIPCGTRGTASAFYQPPFGTRTNVDYTAVKNTILLKLRI